MANTIKTSTTGVAADAPISVYAGSKENADLMPSQKKVFPGNFVGAAYASSNELGTDDVDFEADLIIDEEETSNKEAESGSQESAGLLDFNAPTLSDIQIISNETVYDAAGNPSVTVVFKVKNSSGQELKGINARIQSI